MILAKTSAATEKYFKNFLKKKNPTPLGGDCLVRAEQAAG